MRRIVQNLALRMAGVAALQVAAFVFTAWALLTAAFQVDKRIPPQDVARSVSQLVGEPTRLDAYLQRLRSEQQIDVSLYDGFGSLLFSNVDPALDWRSGAQPRPHSRNFAGPPGEPNAGAPLFPTESLPPDAERRTSPPPFGGPPRHNPRLFPYPLLDWLGEHPREHAPPLAIMAIEHSGSELTMVARFPNEQRDLGAIVAIVFAGVLVVALGSWWTARAVSLPITRLSKTVRAFGTGDFSARSDVSHSDEIGLLARTFNQMAESIHALRATERELLGNVAHELRTPLARIHVALDIAEEGDVATSQRALLGLKDDVKELETLIDDVLTAVRLESPSGAADFVLRRELFDGRTLTRQAQERFAAHHPERPLFVSMPETEVKLAVDATLLRRALANLLENAHKYSPDPSTAIHFSLVTSDEHCEWLVEDAGLGIDPSDHVKVFLPFYRTEQSRSRTTGGVGLGLTLVRRIAEAHDGKIQLQSTLGAGTRVTLELPLVTLTGP